MEPSIQEKGLNEFRPVVSEVYPLWVSRYTYRYLIKLVQSHQLSP